MNPHSSHLMQFVLYSTQQLVKHNGAGFWSNSEGWVEFKTATRFDVASVPSCNMPISEGLDAKWIMWEDEPSAPSAGHTRQAQTYSPIPAY